MPIILPITMKAIKRNDMKSRDQTKAFKINNLRHHLIHREIL